MGARTIVESESYCDLVQLRIPINLRKVLVLIIFIHVVLIAVGEKRVRQKFCTRHQKCCETDRLGNMCCAVCCSQIVMKIFNFYGVMCYGMSFVVNL